MTAAEKLIEKLSKLAMGETKLTDSDKMELIRAVAELKNNLKAFQTGGGVTSNDSISISAFVDYAKKNLFECLASRGFFRPLYLYVNV